MSDPVPANVEILFQDLTPMVYQPLVPFDVGDTVFIRHTETFLNVEFVVGDVVSTRDIRRDNRDNRDLAYSEIFGDFIYRDTGHQYYAFVRKELFNELEDVFRGLAQWFCADCILWVIPCEPMDAVRPFIHVRRGAWSTDVVPLAVQKKRMREIIRYAKFLQRIITVGDMRSTLIDHLREEFDALNNHVCAHPFLWKDYDSALRDPGTTLEVASRRRNASVSPGISLSASPHDRQAEEEEERQRQAEAERQRQAEEEKQRFMEEYRRRLLEAFYAEQERVSRLREEKEWREYRERRHADKTWWQQESQHPYRTFSTPRYSRPSPLPPPRQDDPPPLEVIHPFLLATPRAIFGEHASKKDITSKYRNMVLLFHPDKHTPIDEKNKDPEAFKKWLAKAAEHGVHIDPHLSIEETKKIAEEIFKHLNDAHKNLMSGGRRRRRRRHTRRLRSCRRKRTRRR